MNAELFFDGKQLAIGKIFGRIGMKIEKFIRKSMKKMGKLS
jgi:hypothetical protein